MTTSFDLRSLMESISGSTSGNTYEEDDHLEIRSGKIQTAIGRALYYRAWTHPAFAFVRSRSRLLFPQKLCKRNECEASVFDNSFPIPRANFASHPAAKRFAHRGMAYSATRFAGFGLRLVPSVVESSRWQNWYGVIVLSLLHSHRTAMRIPETKQ